MGGVGHARFLAACLWEARGAFTDVRLVCRDGGMEVNRLVVGLVLPWLAEVGELATIEEMVVVLPHTSLSSMVTMVRRVLGVEEGEGGIGLENGCGGSHEIVVEEQEGEQGGVEGVEEQVSGLESWVSRGLDTEEDPRLVDVGPSSRILDPSAHRSLVHWSLARGCRSASGSFCRHTVLWEPIFFLHHGPCAGSCWKLISELLTLTVA